MGNTNEASKADLGKGVIGVRRGGSLIPTLHHVVPTPFPTVRGVLQFMGALYRFKSAKSIAKTAKFSLRFFLIFVNSTNPSPTSSIALLTANVGATIGRPLPPSPPQRIGSP